MCYGRWLRGRVTTNFWGSGRGASAGCHCTVGGVTTKFAMVGGVTTNLDVVPLLGATVVCYMVGVGIFLYIDNTKNCFCYLGSMLV